MPRKGLFTQSAVVLLRSTPSVGGDRRTWRVQFKGGEVLELGKAIGMTYGMPEALEVKGLGIVRWRPVVRRDLEHPNNVVVYRWQHYKTRGILYLTDIYDTPSLSAPTNVASFAHHTQLNWDGIAFPGGNHQSPERATADFRLARVAVASKSWSASGAREIYRVYSLDYYLDRTAATYNAATHGPLWHHTFLKQIRMSGHCGKTENTDGTMGASLDCDRGTMPPVRFEYSPGTVGGFSAPISPVQAGPPGAANSYSVLPYPKSAAIIDFDRDGLPDVVQSWDAPICNFSRAVAVRDQGVSGQPELWCLRQLSSSGSGEEVGGYDFSMHTARPILGYQNRGRSLGSAGTFRYQCMDAGSMSDDNSITQVNGGPYTRQREHIAQFLNSEGNTPLGPFGNGLGIWGRQHYLPFYARSLGQPTLGRVPSPRTSRSADAISTARSTAAPSSLGGDGRARAPMPGTIPSPAISPRTPLLSGSSTSTATATPMSSSASRTVRARVTSTMRRSDSRGSWASATTSPRRAERQRSPGPASSRSLMTLPPRRAR